MKTEILKSIKENKMVVVDFYATWCGPCQMYLPIFDKVSQDTNTDDIKFFKVNIDENSEFMKESGVKSVPTTIIYFNGKEYPTTGFQNEETLKNKIVDIFNSIGGEQ